MVKLDRVKSIFKQKNTKKLITCSGIFLVGLLLIIGLRNSFASITPVSSVVVQSTTLSYSEKEEGSWQYTKTAKWVSKGKARINIKLETIEKSSSEYTDVILVLDTSGSMVKDKLAQVQNDVNELINDTIPKGNKIALITFSEEASVVTDFTDDTTLLQNSINNLVTSGETNYYQALVKVNDVLKNYNKETSRDCVVLFLTDGLPTIETPNEVGQYNYLKKEYEYLSINGIQYELGDKVLSGIKNITDFQYVANKNSLNEFLYKASTSAASYDKFILTDYVDGNYFNLDDVTNISTTFGKVSVSNHNVIWDLSGLKSGTIPELTIDINLNDNLIGVGGVYSTHKKADVVYEITSTSATESSKKTPMLSDNYIVSYEANTPTGCVVSNMPSKKNYSVFDTVKIEDTVPTCAGYQFKEWKIVTDGVKKVGNDQFIMPESNVTIKAVWKKLSLVKSMDGTIAKVQTLYRLMADNSKGVDTSIDFSQDATTTDSGIYTLEGTETDKYPVHYYRGIIDNNNVLFAGFCWKMVRTTSTGGVKLIYNGVPDDNNSCNNTGVNSQLSSESAFNTNSSSLADAGYMYGARYTYSDYETGTSVNILDYAYINSSSNYYYGDSVIYSNGTYTLINFSQKTWSDNYSSLAGYYTCKNTSTTCSTVYYVVGAEKNYLYTLSLSDGITDPSTQTITLGKEMNDNGDGTYSLIEPITIEKKDWYTTYSIYEGYYICRDLTSTTCENKNLIILTYDYRMIYDNTFNFIYGNDVSWDGSKYTLIDTFTSTNSWLTDRTTISKKSHYTCLNTLGECTNVYYIHYFGYSYNIYSLPLSSGEDIETAKDKMFTNTNTSTIKQTVDNWYEKNLLGYTNRLEDTIWCNDRTFAFGSLVGKDEDAGENGGYSIFGADSRTSTMHNPSVICPNEERDGFTVSTTSGGNGALTYPVGLLTADEAMLAGENSFSNWSVSNNYYLYTGVMYWTLSPEYISEESVLISLVDHRGHFASASGLYSHGVRPVISLKKGTKYTVGYGTADNPYVVE